MGEEPWGNEQTCQVIIGFRQSWHVKPYVHSVLQANLHKSRHFEVSQVPDQLDQSLGHLDESFKILQNFQRIS